MVATIGLMLPPPWSYCWRASGTDGLWVFILLGVALAATAIRAALKPTVIRLTTLGTVMLAIPVIGQVI